jgi:hypothetical protein
VLRFIVGLSGSVVACDVLLDRVVHADAGHTEWEALRGDLVDRVKALKFPPAAGETTVTQPLAFEARLPGPR